MMNEYGEPILQSENSTSDCAKNESSMLAFNDLVDKKSAKNAKKKKKLKKENKKLRKEKKKLKAKCKTTAANHETRISLLEEEISFLKAENYKGIIFDIVSCDSEKERYQKAISLLKGGGYGGKQHM